MNINRMFIVGGLITALALSGCASQPGGGGTASASGAADPAAGVAAAKAFADQNLPNPTSIGIDTPLSKKAPTGKLIIGLASPSRISQVIADTGWIPAAAALGWKAKYTAVGTDPEAIQKAFDSALAQNPDGIIVSGFDPATYAAQLAEAKQRNIPVVAQSIPVPVGNGIVASVNSGAGAQAAAEMVAAQMIAESKGNVHLAFATIASAPTLKSVQAGIQQAFDKWCAACTLSVVNASYADIGSALPGQLVSTVQRDPKINYIYFAIGDMAVGVYPALQAAGLTNQVKLGGGAASKDTLPAIKSNQADAYSGFPVASIGYLSMDAMARYFAGGDTSVSSKAGFPTQIITSANVGNLVLSSDGDYVGVAGFADKWKALWLVN